MPPKKNNTKANSGTKSVTQKSEAPRYVWTLKWLCGLVAVLLYANTLTHSYVLDDYSLIKENLLTQKGFSSLPTIFSTSYRSGYYLPDNDLYRPLSKAMFAIEWGMAPDTPWLSHLVNVLIYGFSGILLYRLLLRITKQQVELSFAIALLYICHPIHTEVVANIKSRDELLSWLFFLLMGLETLAYVDTNKTIHLVSAFFAFALALLSKESSIDFLIVVPLLVWVFALPSKQQWLRIAVLFSSAAALFLFLRYQILGAAPGGIHPSLMDNLLMATSDRLLQLTTAIALLGLYLKLLLVPHPLVSDYSYNQIELMGWNNWHFIASAALLAVMAFIGWKELKKKSLLGFGILFWFLTSALISNIGITIGTSFGERLMFTPSFGICILGGAVALQYIKNKKQRWWVLGLVLVLFCGKTISRNRAWKDNLTLHRTDVLLSPNSARAHFYFGNIISQDEYLAKIKDPAEKRAVMDTALEQMRWTLKIYPAYADAFHKIGKLYLDLQRYDSAGVYYLKALALNPGNSMYLNNYGNILFHLGKLPEARDEFEKSIASNPNQADAFSNLGSVYGTMGQQLLAQHQNEEARKNFELAIGAFQKCIAVAPNYAPAYYMIGITYQSLGNATDGQLYIDKAKALNPSYH